MGNRRGNYIMEPLIKLENVWKKFKLGGIEVPVLRGVNLDITQESFATIMGPSGSGKSTLMYLLGLLDTPSEGKIYMQGQDVAGFSDDKLAQLRGEKIGFIFQQFNLLQNLTALENVMLPMIFQGVPEEERKDKAKKLLESVNLGKRMSHKPSEMSGGEQQRIAIARSLVNNPEILIEEMLNHLEIPFEKGDLGELIENAPDSKRTMDFIIPNKQNPLIIAESSFLATTSSGQGDKSKTEISIDSLIKSHYPKAKFIGFVDGIGWYVRKGDLKRMVTAYEDVFTFHKEELRRFEKLIIDTFLKK